MDFYLYAETAFHHEGDISYLLKLIDEAKLAGCGGVKFQVLIELDEFMSTSHSSYLEAQSWLLTFEEWIKIFDYTVKLGLDLILMPLDTRAIKLIELFEIKYIELHSVSFKDQALLSEISSSDKPLIFGVGGRTLEEIDYIVNKYQNREIILMVGHQSFPSELVDIKLNRIKFLLERYPNCQVGYADHSSYKDEMAIVSNDYAYILGARVFEKHIAVEEGMERIDWQSSVSRFKINEIINRLKFLSLVLASNQKELFEFSEKELIYRNRQKKPVALVDIPEGEIITAELITMKMVDDDNAIDSAEFLYGKKVNKVVNKNEVFLNQDIK